MPSVLSVLSAYRVAGMGLGRQGEAVEAVVEECKIGPGEALPQVIASRRCAK